MAQGDPTKWEYFESLNVVVFLQLCLFYHDKNKDLEQQRRILESRR